MARQKARGLKITLKHLNLKTNFQFCKQCGLCCWHLTVQSGHSGAALNLNRLRVRRLRSLRSTVYIRWLHSLHCNVRRTIRTIARLVIARDQARIKHGAAENSTQRGLRPDRGEFAEDKQTISCGNSMSKLLTLETGSNRTHARVLYSAEARGSLLQALRKSSLSAAGTGRVLKVLKDLVECRKCQRAESSRRAASAERATDTERASNIKRSASVRTSANVRWLATIGEHSGSTETNSKESSILTNSNLKTFRGVAYRRPSTTSSHRTVPTGYL